MGARGVRRTDGVDDSQLTILKERLQGLQAGMETEEAVEIDGCAGRAATGRWNGNCGAQLVVVGFGKRNDYVESIHRAALKEHDHLLFARRGGSGYGALQKRRERSHAEHGDATVFQEITTRDSHSHPPCTDGPALAPLK